jgi:hypothetical protein
VEMGVPTGYVGDRSVPPPPRIQPTRHGFSRRVMSRPPALPGRYRPPMGRETDACATPSPRSRSAAGRGVGTSRVPGLAPALVGPGGSAPVEGAGPASRPRHLPPAPGRTRASTQCSLAVPCGWVGCGESLCR